MCKIAGDSGALREELVRAPAVPALRQVDSDLVDRLPAPHRRLRLRLRLRLGAAAPARRAARRRRLRHGDRAVRQRHARGAARAAPAPARRAISAALRHWDTGGRRGGPQRRGNHHARAGSGSGSSGSLLPDRGSGACSATCSARSALRLRLRLPPAPAPAPALAPAPPVPSLVSCWAAGSHESNEGRGPS